MEKKSVRIAVYVLAVLMLSTGILYLTLAYDENKSHQEEVQASATTNEREAGEAGEQAKTTSESNGFGDIGEIVFFSVVGTSYIPIGLMILKKKEFSRKPYVIALIGSAALIVFYVATRTVNIPMIGIQDDVGTSDLTAKALQIAIVVVSAHMLTTIARFRRTEKIV